MRLTRLIACSALLAISLASGRRSETTTRLAASVRPGFDPKEVVGRVHSARAASPMQGLDFGEFLLDTVLVIGPAAKQQRHPQAAFDGENWLVVWDDTRTGHYAIYGSLVTQEGTLLDRSGIEINSQFGGFDPAVAYNGTTYLVAWNSYSSSDSSHNLYAARVTREGVVLDPEGFIVSAAPGNQSDASVASDGSGWLVAWQD